MNKYVLIFGLFLFLLTSSCARRVVVTTPGPNATLVRVAPPNHRIVVVKGRRYYFWDSKYYRKTRRGFVYVRL